jgi:hypothetical protein
VIAVPDFSTLSRRGNGLTLQTKPKVYCQSGIHLVVDSTGLRIFDEGKWPEKKHKTKRKRRSWCKLHLDLDLVSRELVCSDLTKDDVGDPTELPGFWIKSTVRLIESLQMEQTTENHHLICWPLDSDRRSRSLSHLPETRFRAPMRPTIRQNETAISPRSKATGGWRGRKPLATTNAAGVKPSWAAGNPSPVGRVLNCI